MEKIKKIQTLSRVTAIDNSADTTAQYAISGEAETRAGALSAIHNGTVRDTAGNDIATFGYYGPQQMQVTFWKPDDDKAAIIAAIEAFTAAAAAADWNEDKKPEV